MPTGQLPANGASRVCGDGARSRPGIGRGAGARRLRLAAGAAGARRGAVRRAVPKPDPPPTPTVPTAPSGPCPRRPRPGGARRAARLPGGPRGSTHSPREAPDRRLPAPSTGGGRRHRLPRGPGCGVASKTFARRQGAEPFPLRATSRRELEPGTHRVDVARAPGGTSTGPEYRSRPVVRAPGCARSAPLLSRPGSCSQQPGPGSTPSSTSVRKVSGRRVAASRRDRRPACRSGTSSGGVMSLRTLQLAAPGGDPAITGAVVAFTRPVLPPHRESVGSAQ
jgi:hypothetical protein